jgi:hypothetical protein
MSLTIDTVLQTTRQVSREIKDHEKSLTVHFIVHHAGQLTETLAVTMHDVAKHPARQIAGQILQNCKTSEQSRFLGVAAAQENIFFGLATRQTLLALATINIEEFTSIREVKRYAYHMAWHALDAFDFYQDPKNRTGQAKEQVLRKRNALELTQANLKADIFSAMASFYTGDKAALEQLSLKRAHDVLCPISGKRPEFFAYAMAQEATSAAVEKVKAQHISKRNLITTSLNIANHAMDVYDMNTLKNWLTFSKPAQDMCWRGHDKSEILSVAINTSPETNVRSIGYMIAEALDIKPKSILDIRDIYSPFADDDYNKDIHIKSVRKTFIETFARGSNTNSSIPLLELANEQNQGLTEGHVLGWCASSLQDAAEAFDEAIEKGEDPFFDLEKRLQDDMMDSEWQALQKLGKKVVGASRKGHAVTLSKLDQLTAEIQGMEQIQKSIGQTMKDPGYLQKLQSIQDYSAKPKLAPQEPSPEPSLAMTPKTPAYAADLAPNLGKAKLPPQQAQTQVQQQEAVQTQDESDKA